jgi:hypothetical protein
LSAKAAATSQPGSSLELGIAARDLGQG